MSDVGTRMRWLWLANRLYPIGNWFWRMAKECDRRHLEQVNAATEAPDE